MNYNKYINIIPTNYNLYLYKESLFDLIFYISKKPIIFNDRKIKEFIGYITFSIDIEDKNSVIKFLEVNKDFQRNGIGTFLLIIAAEYIKTEFNFKYIYLDDDSDNAHLDNNIYLKLGFEYEDKDSNSPEMIGDTTIISNKWFEFFEFFEFQNKYTKKKLFFNTL